MISRWLSAALSLLATAEAMAQEKVSRAHMEACVRWVYAGGEYSTLNSCDTTVNIKLMALQSGQVFEGDVRPGETFIAGPLAQGDPGTMMFTVCPLGYVPSLKFSAENAQPIIVSLYNCLPRSRPDA